MAKREQSPEEKLLGLIRGTKKKEPAEETAPQAPEMPAEKSPERTFFRASERTAEKAPAAATGPKAFGGIFGIFKDGIFRNRLFDPATLKTVNRYLIAAAGILALYFIADLIIVKPHKNIQKLVAKAAAVQNARALPPEAESAIVVKDYSGYSDASSGRTVFGPSQAVPEDAVESVEVTERMGLVGIISGDSPQAIIEDKKAQKTYYLNKGQSFDGYVVEDIAENKVTLDFEGRKIALFL